MARKAKKETQQFFPTSAIIESQHGNAAAAAFFASRVIAAQADEQEMNDAEIEAQQKAADESANAQALNDSIQAAIEAAQNAPKATKIYIPKSSILKPTKVAWMIYDTMRAHALENDLPLPTRKECIDEAIARGIASGTSATQYQYWKKHYGY